MPHTDSRRFFLIILIVFFALVLFVVARFSAPLILGALLAALTYPLYKRLSRSFRNQENLAALIVILIVIILIVIPILTGLTLLGGEAFSYFSDTKDRLLVNTELLNTLTSLNERLRLNIDVTQVIETQVAPALKKLGLIVYEQIGALLSSVLGLIIGFFIMLLTIFYLLRDGVRFGQYLLATPFIDEKDGLHLFQIFKNTGKAILFGNLLTALAQGALGGIGFFMFGLNAPLLWGTIMAFSALIPLLGPFVIYLPAALYLFATASVGKAVLFLFWNLIFVSLVDNIVKPKIIGHQISIHPFVIFLSIIGGIAAFGLLGIIYGPLIASIFLVLVDLYQEHHSALREKDTVPLV